MRPSHLRYAALLVLVAGGILLARGGNAPRASVPPPGDPAGLRAPVSAPEEPLPASLERLGLAPETAAEELRLDEAAEAFVFGRGSAGAPTPLALYEASFGIREPTMRVRWAGDSLGIALTPQEISFQPARRRGAMVVYTGTNPGISIAYRPGADRVKEDVVVDSPEALGSGLFVWRLDLEPQLEARMLPDGSVGVYGPEGFLAADLEIGNDPRTQMRYRIPSPVIVDSNGTRHETLAWFEQAGDRLTVRLAPEVWSLRYPISIDPTVVITATSDFAAGNPEGLTRLGVDRIERDTRGSGRLGPWESSPPLPSGRSGCAMTAFAGHLYLIGGRDADVQYPDVLHAPIGTDGSAGGWAATTPLPSPRFDLRAAAYNGYLYALGGNSFGSYLSDVLYAKINPDGTIGNWTAATAFSTGRSTFGAAAHDGHLYVAGGWNGAYLADVQVAEFRADGTLAAWAATTALPGGRRSLGFAAYDGRLYAAGGFNGASLADVLVAPISSGGGLSAWQAETALPQPVYAHESLGVNGHLYVLGGWDGTTSFADVRSARIRADGALSAWSSTSSFGGARRSGAAAAYDGRLYVAAGFDGTTHLDNVQSSATGQVAMPNSWIASGPSVNSLPRSNSGLVAANGYLYAISGNVFGGTTTDVRYAAVNADGSITSWAPSGWSVGNAYAGPPYQGLTGGFTAHLYNGRMYVIGGEFILCGLSWAYSPWPIQIASVNPDGSLSGLGGTAHPFDVGYAYHGSAIYNGRLYILGGYRRVQQCSPPDPSVPYTYFSAVYFAPINPDGSLGAFTATTSLPGARYGHVSIAANGYLYAIGGSGAGGDALYAPINPDGTIGAWTATTPRPAGGSQAVLHNGRIYAFGNGTVYDTPINPDGTLGTWTQTTSFPTRSQFGAAADNGVLYVLGGYEGWYLPDLLYAPVEAGGSVGAWKGIGDLVPRYVTSSVAWNGYLYALGGYTGTQYFGLVQFAPLRADGTVGPWTSLPGFAARGNHTSVAYDGTIYVIGGSTGGAPFNSVLFAQIQPDGTLSGWGTTASMTKTRSSHASAVLNGFVYAMGGYDGTAPCGCGATLAATSVEFAPILSDGSLGAWATTTALPSPGAAGLKGAAMDGKIYVSGGNYYSSCGTCIPGSYNSVQYATQNATGALSGWAGAGGFPAGRGYHGMGAHGGSIYIVGGQGYKDFIRDGTVIPDDLPAVNYGFGDAVYNGYYYVVGGSTLSGTVYARTLDNSGTVDTTWTATTPLPAAREDHASATYRNFLYALGGTDGATTFDDVRVAPLAADGTAGAWTATTPLPTPLKQHAAFACRGFLYAVGGHDGTGYRNDVLFAPFNTDGTIGAWSAATPFPAARADHTALAYNGYLYVLGGTDGAARAEVYYAPINADGTVGIWATTDPLSSARYAHTTVAYNGRFYVLGGTPGAGYLTSVLQARVNADGTVDPWAATTVLPQGHAWHGSVGQDGWLYVFGGLKTTSGWGGPSYRAFFRTDGTIGPWTQEAVFPLPRRNFSTLVHRGRIYVVGGYYGPTPTYYNEVSFAGFDAPSMIGRWSRLIDLGADQNIGSILVNGTSGLPGTVRMEYRLAPGTTAAFGPRATVNSVPLGTPVTIGGSGRYLWLNLGLDDSASAILALGTPNARDVLDITIDTSLVITLSTGSLVFNGSVGGPNPADQTFSLINNNLPGSTLNCTLTDNAAWLAVSPAASSPVAPASQTVTVSVDMTGLPPGTYLGTITVSDPAAANNPQTVSVTLNVLPPAPAIGLSSASLTFSALESGANPAAQSFSVTNSGAAGSTLSYTASDNAAWLSLAPGFGALAAAASDTLSASVDVTGLAAGTYNAAITVADPGATNTPQTIAVTLTVATPGSLPAISLSPATLSPAATEGGGQVVSSFTLGNPGGSALNYTASFAEPWLSLSSTSGTLGAGGSSTIWAIADPAALGSGAYSAIVTFTDPAAINSPQTLAVNLSVQAAGGGGPGAGAPISLSAVAPDRILIPSAFELALTGSGFLQDGGVAWAQLSHTGQPDLVASEVAILSDTTARATFQADSSVLGGWRTVTVGRGNGSQASLANALFLRRFRIVSVDPSEVLPTGTFALTIRVEGLGPFEQVDLSFALIGPGGSTVPVTLLSREWEIVHASVTLQNAPSGAHTLEATLEGATVRLDGALTVLNYVLADATRFPPTPRTALLAAGKVSLAVAFDAVVPADPPDFELVGERATIRAVSVQSDPEGGTRRLVVRFEWDPRDTSLIGTYDLLVTKGSRVDSIQGALTISPLRVLWVAPQPVPNLAGREATGGDVLEIQGEGFEPGARVRLEFNSNPWKSVSPPPPQGLTVAEETSTLLRAIKRYQVPPGLYDVVIENAQGIQARLTAVPVGVACALSVQVQSPGTRRFGEGGVAFVHVLNAGDFPVPERSLRVEGRNLRIVGTPPDRVRALMPGEGETLPVEIQAFLRNEIPPADLIQDFAARAWLEVSVEPLPADVKAQADQSQAALDAAIQRVETLAQDTQAPAPVVRQAASELAQALEARAEPVLELAALAKTRDPQVEAWIREEEPVLREASDRLELAVPAVTARSETVERIQAAVGQLGRVVEAAATRDWSGAETALWEYGREVKRAEEKLVEEYPAGSTLEVLQEHTGRLWAFFDPDCAAVGSTGVEIFFRTSRDPNEKLVGNPGGVVADGQRVSYMIRFENLAPETGPLPAPALVVEIEDVLDANLDPASVELGAVSHPNALVQAAIDVAGGKLLWKFEALNLPPNVDPPEGEGFVTFTVLPRAGTPSGTVIRNVATIWFDPEEGNPAVSTPEVSVVLDTEPPAFREATILARSDGRARLRLDAQDDASGVRHVRVYGRSSPLGLWAHYGDVALTSPTEVEFVAEPTAEFDLVAIDRAGNRSLETRAVERTSGDGGAGDSGGTAGVSSGGGGGGGGCSARGELFLPASLALVALAGVVAAGAVCRRF